jgi:hypothetical protein
MKIGKKFNQLSISEYKHYIDNYKKYTDFNTLGLYRSIGENERLNLESKIEIRDYANKIFGKTFNFYQLKAPTTYFKLITLGQELTKADEDNIWEEIKLNQQRILKEKRIKHRNFGDYSKHNCGYKTCSLNGIMIRQNSSWAESNMCFASDKSRYLSKPQYKYERSKKEQILTNQIIKEELENEI